MVVTLLALPYRHADLSGRLRQALAAAEIVVAADPARVRLVVGELGLAMTAKVVDPSGVPAALNAAAAGAPVAVVADLADSALAATVVRGAVEAGVPVTVVPGPAPVTTALAWSGLPSDRFCVEGPLPGTVDARRAALAELATEEQTVLFTVRSQECRQALADAAEALGPSRAAAVWAPADAVGWRGTLGQLSAGEASLPSNGPAEVVLVIAGAAPVVSSRPDDASLAAEVRLAEAAPMTRKEAIAAVASRHRLPKREVYDAVLRHRG
ncbi:MAG TPA: 16S rRNA (cytidine(1402)-2'-O)-methyltransferase [Micromonosporaceae bacterium]